MNSGSITNDAGLPQVESGRPPIIYVLSNLTFPAREGQHTGHCTLMRQMRAAGYEVILVSLVRNVRLLDTKALSNAVGGLAAVEVIESRLNYPGLLVRNLLFPARGSRVVKAVRVMLTRWPSAILHFEGIGLVPLVPLFAQYPILVTTTDAWSLRQRRLADRARSWPMRRGLLAYAALSAWVERRYFPQASAVQVVSPIDAAYLQRQSPAARITVIPIALPDFDKARAQIAPAVAGSLPTVLFWGDIGVPHIAEGLDWLLRKVKNRVPLPANWVVLGRRPPSPSLESVAPEVRFLTWHDDIDGLLRSADVVVLPDAAGTGLKNRAAHAMACGVPVVGTAAAFEGFDVTDECNAMVKSTAETFSDAITRLLSNPAAARQLALAGQKFAIGRYSAVAVGQRWLTLYASLMPRLKANT